MISESLVRGIEGGLLVTDGEIDPNGADCISCLCTR